MNRTRIRIWITIIACGIIAAGWYVSYNGDDMSPRVPILSGKPLRVDSPTAGEMPEVADGQKAGAPNANTPPPGAKITDRRALLSAERKFPPLLDVSVVRKFVQENSVPGAYVAAAGALRDRYWLTEGLRLFPGDPVLLRASALMDNAYLKDPALLEAWGQAEPQNGWPKILQADILLGRKDAAAAYAAIAEGLKQDTGAGKAVPEIAILAEEYSLGKNRPNFQDLNGDLTYSSRRIAGDFMAAAKQAAVHDDVKFYAAAALTLFEIQTEVGYSETESAAAAGALDALRIIGESDASQFLNNISYLEAEQRYSEIMTRSTAVIDEADELRSGLDPIEKRRFDELRNQYGSARALDLFQHAKNRN